MSPAARAPLRRDPARGVLGGVCAGAAAALGVDAVVLRVAFVLGTALGGAGVALYVLAWALLPAAHGEPPFATRLRAAPGSGQVAAGAGCLALAGLLALRELGFWAGDAVVWPLVLAASGAALVWRQSAERADEVVSAPPPVEPRRLRRPSALGLYRGGFGVALILGAGLLFLQTQGALVAARDVVLAAVVVLLSLGLVLAPVWWRLGRRLAAERAERIRSQERAEVAAHLHDSVLQTLALIQRRADDPRHVSTLARRQERELRAWLSGAPAARPDERLADALRDVAADVEQAHGVAVEVVTVGDGPMDERAEALVAATREALVNAAKFAGDAGPVSLFAEAEDGRVQVFVRDRGPGFAPDAVPPDRQGIRESIVGRMARHGGVARIGAAPGGGTEVELTLEGLR